MKRTRRGLTTLSALTHLIANGQGGLFGRARGPKKGVGGLRPAKPPYRVRPDIERRRPGCQPARRPDNRGHSPDGRIAGVRLAEPERDARLAHQRAGRRAGFPWAGLPPDRAGTGAERGQYADHRHSRLRRTWGGQRRERAIDRAGPHQFARRPPLARSVAHSYGCVSGSAAASRSVSTQGILQCLPAGHTSPSFHGPAAIVPPRWAMPQRSSALL
jgi:hypothetical protein